MANSKYEYVRSFEQPDILLANTWIVVRIDGRGFSKFTAKYKFVKPNDRRALDLMNTAAEAVMKELPDLVLAYGNSDEFSFVFHKDCVLFERRASKLTTTIVSTFTSYYTFLWATYFPDSPLTPPLPSFDGRAVIYPRKQNLRDYMSWRQADCHINNLYNTTFWALVQQGGMEARAAEQELSGTVSSDKNEILFSRFGINYNNEPEIFKKGSVLYRDFFPTSELSSQTSNRAMESPTPLSQPQPRKALVRPMSQPIERTFSGFTPDSPLSAESTPRGPTFLSTSTTPSPPPSPSSMSIPTFPFPQAIAPASPPLNGPATTPSAKQPRTMLTPLPLGPPKLKPSTRPPPSLSPPNPTAHTNTSPQTSPVTLDVIQSRLTARTFKTSNPTSHSASASLSIQTGFPSTTATPPKPTLKHRSPSLSVLEGQPPIIPLRISSIPLNNKPRKLSLPSLKVEEKENIAIMSKPSRTSPPLWTMKELPSPPTDNGHGDRDSLIPSPIRASPRPDISARRSQSHSRLPSLTHVTFPSPPSDTKTSNAKSSPPPHTYTPPNAKAHMILGTRTQTSTPSSKATVNSSKSKSKINEEGGWAAGTRRSDGRPKEMSRTQREKDRKKRSKARIVIEHVDVIKDEFWDKRPWILSGRTG